MQVTPSARRHGIADEEMLHAIEHRVAVEDLGDDPDRWLVIGPDRAGNLLEVVVLIPESGEPLVIHAMNMTAQYRRLLP